MNISNNKGDSECTSWLELENLIKESSSNPFDDIWLSPVTDYPCLTILVNGNHACVHYFLNDDGDIWQAVGYGDKDIEFISNGEKSEMPADSVISISEAIACAKQFYSSSDKPNCVEWREL